MPQTKTLTITCYNCLEVFTVQAVEMEHGGGFSATCPHCGATITMTYATHANARGPQPGEHK